MLVRLFHSLGLVIAPPVFALLLVSAVHGQEPDCVTLGDAGVPQEGADIAAFSPDGKIVAVAFPNHAIGLWQTNSGKLERTLQTQGVLTVNTGEPSPTQFAFSPDGRWLAATLGTLYHGHLVLWDVQSGKPIWAKGEVSGVHSFPLAFSSDGSELVTTGRADSTSMADLSFWDPARGRVLHGMQVRAPGEHMIQSLAFSADGKHWATTQYVDAPSKNGEWSSVISVWTRGADKPERTWPASAGQVRCLSYAPAGDLLIGRCVSPNHIEVWDRRTGSLEHRFSLGGNASCAVAVSSDPIVLTAASNGGLQRWDLDTGRPCGSTPKNTDKVLALSSDGSLVLLHGSDSGLRVCKVSSLLRQE